jgi:hypothetical protein
LMKSFTKLESFKVSPRETKDNWEPY